MVWGNTRVGGTPPSLFWGQRIQRKLEFLSKILLPLLLPLLLQPLLLLAH